MLVRVGYDPRGTITKLDATAGTTDRSVEDAERASEIECETTPEGNTAEVKWEHCCCGMGGNREQGGSQIAAHRKCFCRRSPRLRRFMYFRLDLCQEREGGNGAFVRKFERKEIIQNEISLGGSPTIKVTQDKAPILESI